MNDSESKPGMERLGRIPLLPSSRVLRADNQSTESEFSSNGDYDGDGDGCEPMQSITVSNSYFSNEKGSSSLPPYSIRYGHKLQSFSQSQNLPPTQKPRYRTSCDGKKILPIPPPHQPRPLYSSYNSDIKLLPSLLPSSIQPRAHSSPTLPTLSSHTHSLLFPIHKVSPSSHSQQRLLSLTFYFSLNLVLTLYNKLLLTRFPFPYTLTALHALSASIGGRVVSSRGQGRMKMRQGQGKVERMVILGFSVLYAVNIAVSNVSLHLVTVPFHQVVRASTPIFTISLSAILFGTMSSQAKITALVPVILGVGLATYGDYYFTPSGLLLTLLGTFLASLKTIYTNILQMPTSPSASSLLRKLFIPPPLNLHPLDLLTQTAPLAFIQLIAYAQLSGELTALRSFTPTTTHILPALFGNAFLAFLLNYTSFSTNAKIGAVGMGVAGNVKQVLTVLVGVGMFGVRMGWVNGVGIVCTLVGGVWYTVVDWREKEKGRGRAS